MQNLDPAGNYSDEEVKAALSGETGTRDWAFRYARLDSRNNYIDDIDFVDSCTIDNNIFADIKRTAKFKIHDQGNINYLSDRIKPYVRLNMPKETTYNEYIHKLDPFTWFKFDEAWNNTVIGKKRFGNLPESLTHQTAETADIFNEPGYNVSFNAPIAQSSATVGSTYWVVFPNNSADPISIDLLGFDDMPFEWEVFTSTGLEDFDLQSQGSSNGPEYAGHLTFLELKGATYWVKLTASQPSKHWVTLDFSRLTKVNNAARNGVSFVGTRDLDSPFRGAPVINDGGTAIRPKALSQDYLTVTAVDMMHNMVDEDRTGFSINFWTDSIPDQIQTLSVFDDMSYYMSFVIMNNEDSVVFASSLFGDEGSADSAVMVPLSAFKSGTPQMVTMTLNKESLSVYIDGRKSGESLGNISSGVTVEEFLNSVSVIDITQVVVSNANNPKASSVDEFTFYLKDLSNHEARRIYDLGSNQSVQRPGYVEWPQGVFLLSSPSRTFSDGNTSFRSVEAYDQLLALREDSYDYRYTALKGTNCVTELEKVIGVGRRENLATDPTGYGYANPYSRFTTNTAIMTNSAVFVNSPRNPSDNTRGMRIDYNLISKPADYEYSVATGAVVDSKAFGREVTFKAWVKSAVAATIAFVEFGPNRVASNIAVPANTWVQISVTGVFASFGDIYVNWATPLGAGSVWMTEPQLELGKTSGSFFSGSTGDTPETSYVWSGVANQSTSYASSIQKRVTASNQTFTETMEWEPGTSKLQIVNDILAYINYDSAWYDENGVFVAEPYLLPSQRSSQFTYATDEDSVITSDDISQSLDMFSIPNRWILISSEPDSPTMVGSYTNEDPMSPTSTVSRGRTIVDYRTEESASDQITLDAKAERLAFEASQVYEKVEFSTGLMPIHSNGDTYDIIVDELAIRNKYNETAWSMILEAGATMKHQVRRIVQV